MAQEQTYFHLAGPILAPESIVLPGNWGRVIRQYGWAHNQALREMALEAARLERFARRPSRLESAFVFLTLEEARTFKQAINGFTHHVLYRVTLSDPSAVSHITDSRLCSPQGTLRGNWADVYWLDFEAQSAAIPGIDWTATTGGVLLREMLTLSQLRIEERLD